jgi:outer membrane protein assembly factor BamB
VCAIDIATGELLWTAAMGGDPMVADGVVYHLCDQEGDAVCARSLATGDPLWKSADVAHLGGAAPILPVGTGESGGPIMAGGVLFANVWDSSLQQWTTAGFDPATGRLLTFRRHDIFGPKGG